MGTGPYREMSILVAGEMIFPENSVKTYSTAKTE